MTCVCHIPRAETKKQWQRKWETRITSLGVGQSHLCQAKAAGVIVQSAIIIQDTCEEKTSNEAQMCDKHYLRPFTPPFTRHETVGERWEVALTTVSVWRVGAQADVARHQQLWEQRSDFLHRQYRRRVVRVGARAPVILMRKDQATVSVLNHWHYSAVVTGSALLISDFRESLETGGSSATAALVTFNTDADW